MKRNIKCIYIFKTLERVSSVRIQYNAFWSITKDFYKEKRERQEKNSILKVKFENFNFFEKNIQISKY